MDEVAFPRSYDSTMTNTILSSISNFEKYLLSSTTFWASLSTAAITGAILSIYSTQRYANSSIYIISTIIVILHIIIFFSNSQNLKATFATFFHGSAMKWALRITAMRIAYMLHYVPGEHSFVGLVFVICVWIDVVSVSRIIRPESDLWMTNAVFMAIVGRSNELYGFTLYYWLVMLFCFPLVFIQVRLDGYNNEETKEKHG